MVRIMKMTRAMSAFRLPRPGKSRSWQTSAMPDSPEKSDNEPDLELPSLRIGFGRKRKKKDRASGPSPDAPPTTDPVAAEPAAEPLAPADPAEETATLPSVAAPEPVAEADRPVPETTPLPSVAAEEPAPRPAKAAKPLKVKKQKAPREKRQRSRPRLPAVPGAVAAVIAGVVTGLVIVGLGYLAAGGCEAVRGVSTCGGFGLLALIVILAIGVLLGAAILRAWGLGDATSTAFLGVGLVAVLAMLFFLQQIDSLWMLLVIPVLTALTFLLSWWVTATFIEGADESSQS